jgi:hypothetical protein
MSIFLFVITVLASVIASAFTSVYLASEQGKLLMASFKKFLNSSNVSCGNCTACPKAPEAQQAPSEAEKQST